jgi:hypothetical protein
MAVTDLVREKVSCISDGIYVPIMEGYVFVIGVITSGL